MEGLNCSECGRFLGGRPKLICGRPKCRNAKRRRLRAEEREERERVTSLHPQSDGSYRVGVSPFYVRPELKGDWGVYGLEIDGWVHVPAPWAFETLDEAGERGFALEREHYLTHG
jgi:hypothetical protein